MRRTLSRLLVLLALCTMSACCRASIGVLVGEPYGSFGTIMPVGHTAIYLDHLCAESPTSLRYCRSGESGVVVARYHDLADLDWMSTPVIPFLYGVESPEETPSFVTAERESRVREEYRVAHLSAIVPDRFDRAGHKLAPASGDWSETIGSAFDRRLFLYEIDTTPQQDAALLAWLNARPNHRRYSLRSANCANFAADAVNFLYPGAVRRNRLADFGMLTPKQAVRSLSAYAHRCPSVHLRVFQVSQLSGELRRSRPLRGAAEMFVTTKRYAVFLAVAQPELLLADLAIYAAKGRWHTGSNAALVTPDEWSIRGLEVPAATSLTSPPDACAGVESEP